MKGGGGLEGIEMKWGSERVRKNIKMELKLKSD